MKRFFALSFCFIVYCTSWAQVESSRSKLKLSSKLDLHSSHLWRGFKNGNSLSIQPTVAVSNESLNFGAWAAYASNDSYFEIDLFAEYTYKSVTFSLYDYYCPTATQINGFLEFRKHQTRHTLDAMINWNPRKVPFRVLASTFVLGDDISPKTGNQAYSTYIEPAFVWNYKKISGDVLFGFTPFKGYYAQNFSFVNLGTSISYKMKIGRFELPIQAKGSYNPALKLSWYSIGITISSATLGI